MSSNTFSLWLKNRPRTPMLLVALMLTYFAVNGIIAARTHTPTDDEFIQLPMGYYHLKTGHFDIDRRNPPLMKILNASPLLLMDAKLDTDPKWRKSGEGWWMWIFGTRFMHINADQYFDLFFAGRLVNIMMGLVGALLVYFWAKLWFGTTPALGALLLYCTTPVLLGHASVATLDVGVTVFIFAGFFALYRLAKHPHWKWALISGSLFGCALASKFITLLFLPLIPLLLAFEWKPLDRKGLFHWAGMLALITLAGWLVVDAAYFFKGFPIPNEMIDGIVFKTLERSQGKSLSFLLGIWSTHGWWYYYLVDLFYKSTVPFLLLLIAAAYGLMKYLKSSTTGHFRNLQELCPILWVGLPPLFLIYVLSFHFQINFGVRYILAAFPFLILIAGYGIKTMLEEKISGILLLGALLIWQILACTLATPLQLAYFNETAGGANRTRYLLLDSNLDWGQDLGRLKNYMEKNRIDQIQLGYFGSVDPKLYGINYSLPPFQPEPGLYAISANYLSGLPPAITYLESTPLYAPKGDWSWLNDFEPIARVGSSIYIFKISKKEAMVSGEKIK